MELYRNDPTTMLRLAALQQERYRAPLTEPRAARTARRAGTAAERAPRARLGARAIAALHLSRA